MRKNLINKTKIFTSIFLSLIVINLLSPKIFLGSTPHLNPVLVQNLLHAPQSIIARFNGTSKTPSNPELGTSTNEKAPENAIARVIAPGVIAAETDTATYLTIKEGTKLNIKTMKLEDGTEVDVFTP